MGKFISNKDRQKRLDEEKWLESEQKNEDMSGAMYYCDYCDKQSRAYTCKATQQERENKNLCATAYNRFKRYK